MNKEFEDYWKQHQKHLILNAPRKMREDYLESTKLNTPLDWICFIVPIGVGITVQPLINLGSEILSWAIILLLVVVLFALLQMVKPLLQKKKTTIQVIEHIKQYYYERYLEKGLDNLEPWKD